MAAERPQNAGHLLSIPTEIRWILYRLLFDAIRIRCDRSQPAFERSAYYWLHLQMPPEFAILLTCRQILHEGKQHFYEHATFDLSDMPSYESFFDALPSSIRGHVRTIEGLKITRGVQSFSLPTMKPDAADMNRWLGNFTNLSKLTLAVDTVVTLQGEKFLGTQSLDDITFDDILETITSPFTSTGRPKWSLKPLIELIETHANIDFAVIFKLRTVSAQFRGVRSLDKLVVHMDVRNRTVQLADSSFSDGVFIAREPQIQTHMGDSVVATRGGRRIAYTRGGIFAL